MGRSVKPSHPPGSQPGKTATGAAHEEQATKRKKRGQRGGRRRGKGARTLRQINAAAVERQGAWAEADRPNATYKLTGELGGLYLELRGERAGLIDREPALDVDRRVDRPTPRRIPGSAGGLLP